MSANHPGDADTRDSPPLAHARERQRSDSAVLQQRREWVQSAGNAGSGGFSPTGSGSMQPPLPLLNHNHAHVITAANVAPRSSSLTAGSHSPDQGNLQNQAQQPSQSTFTRLKNLVFSSGSKSLSQGNIPNDTTLLDPQNSMLALQQGPPGGAPTSKTSIADLFKRSNSNVSPNAALSPTGSTYGSTLDPNTLLGQKSSSTRGGIFRSHSGSNVEVVSDSQTPRSRRGSLNSSTPMSRSGSATAIDLPPGAAETEGLVFGASIADAASRAGKNGIPDIVIQCVEYLERKGFLETEGLYRVPGSIKRVKEWTAKFDSLGQSLGSTYSQKSQHQAENGINQAPIMKFANIRQKTNESMRSLNTTSPSGLQPSTSALSLLAFSGSASIKGSTFAVAENSVTPNLVTPILILDSDHAKIGDKSHGLWGNDGCASTLGFPVLLEVDTAPTIASLLKKYLASVKGKFAPPGMWDELDKIAMDMKMEPPTPEALVCIRAHIDAVLPSPEHLHTFAYVMLHLHHVQALSSKNLMTAKNLSICIFISSKEGAEYVMKYANIIFGNIELAGKDVIELLPDWAPLPSEEEESTELINPTRAWLDSPEPGSKQDAMLDMPLTPAESPNVNLSLLAISEHVQSPQPSFVSSLKQEGLL